MALLYAQDHASRVKKIFEIGGGRYETFRLGSDVEAGLFWVQMGG